MTVFDLYSKRQKKLRGEVPDVYVYDKISDSLRRQLIYIWRDALGEADEYLDPRTGEIYQPYEFIIDALYREHPLLDNAFTGRISSRRNYFSELVDFTLNEQDTEKLIDGIQLSFWYINLETRKWFDVDRFGYPRQSNRADAAIAELNARFQEHGVGFQFIDGDIIRVDSELIHTEVIKPALNLLHGAEYAGAQAEFLKAHEHYRHGNAKEALNECLKALESTMKAICDKRGWAYQANVTCNGLIRICFEKNLIPAFWQSHLTALRTTLEDGVSVPRNKLGGHGQGSEVVEVPIHLVAYVLHMTAAAIVFLANSESALA